jgi:ubiquinone/menaquinone biosynthesis C-methylase UbiE
MENFIQQFWNDQAKKFKGSPKASWGDNFALELEHKNISDHIVDGDNVLDAGCANGFASIRHATEKKVNVTGIDYAESMIDHALQNLSDTDLTNVNFSHGDITSLKFPDESFDVVYTTRVLINLPNWEEQKKGILECIRVTKKGGKIVLSEGFFEPFMKLNSIRNVFGLSSLEEHDFNRYIKKYRIEKFLSDNGLEYQNIDFSSIYYLGSRVMRDLLTNPSDYEGYSNPVNKDFYELELKYSGSNIGIQQIYVISKKL